MVLSSTLVNVSEDAELRLVALLGETGGQDFTVKCNQCIERGDAANLVKTIIMSGPVMQKLVQSDEGGAAVQILAALLQKGDKNNGGNGIAFANAIVSVPGDDLQIIERKIGLLAVVYNMLEPKCATMQRMIEAAAKFPETLLAEDTVLGRLLLSDSPRIVGLIDSWENVSVTDRRKLYSTICNSSSGKRKQRFLLLLLGTYSSSSSVDAVGIAAAKDAAIGAIRDPVSLFDLQRNMLYQPAVQALQKSEADLLGLLTIFQEGKLQDYENFFSSGNKSESSVLSQWGLEPEACKRNMRILSLCSLASEHEEIPYEVISQTLHLQAIAEVETWVIAAVNSGLLHAKMDQLTQKVMVERCIVRKFDMDQWRSLQVRLTSWKANVGGILAALKESKVTTPATTALH
jgi:translation initiation factor 3 subunit M